MSFQYVLRYGGKNPHFTQMLHIWFDYLGFPPPQGKANWQAFGGVFTLETRNMVVRFQQRWNIVPKPPRKYGEVAAREWQQLGIAVGYKAFDWKMYQCLYKGNQCPPSQENINFFRSIGGYQGNSLTGGINVYAPRFIAMYSEEFGGFDGEVLRGLGAFLDFMRSDANLADVRHVAYMMATVYHETRGTWQPIDEKGKGAGRSYGKSVQVECGGRNYSNIYYGRGYAQLTAGGLYKFVDEKLGLGCTLVANPDRAKEPELAYKILSNGMKDGWYIRNEYLSKYINEKLCDYYNARNIVNTAYDRATDIQGYAKIFEAMLRSTMKWR